jgi:hypothetical protein
MTTGLFFSSSMPRVILGEVNEEWRRQLVGDYLDVNVICGPGIKARLVGGKLEWWDLFIETKSSACYLQINFCETSKNIVKFSIQTCSGKDDTMLRNLAVTKLEKCHDMYSYVQLIYSLL